MRLSNLEEGSFWGRDDLVKRMKDEEKASGMKKFVKIDDGGSHHGVTTSDKEKWEELKAQGYKEDENYFNEAEDGPISHKVRNIDNILKSMGADNPSDIIADIMHWLDANPDEDLGSLIRRANGYYHNELKEFLSDHRDIDMNEGGEGSGPKHKEVTVTKDGKSKVVKKIAAKVFTDAGWKVETDLNEFGPDERYMKIGNNTMIANKKTGSVSSTLSLGGDKSATVNNHLNKDGSAGKVSARGTINGVKFKASNNITGTAPKASASMNGVTINASKEPKVREAGSPWTTTGKHPEKMTTDELWAEIAVFDELQDRGETLSPKDMMRLDSLFSYLDTAEMNEQIKRKADSMMESAVWKAKRNK